MSNQTSDQESLTYEQYLAKYSKRRLKASKKSDEPQDVAEKLASETIEIFRRALAPTPATSVKTN